MHPSTKTSILYAAPRDPTHRLLPLCQRLRAVFEEKEYLIEDTRPLKLHATIVNTIYAKAGGRYGRGKPAAAQILAPEPNLTPVDVPEDATESVEEPEPAEREDEVKASSKPDDHRNRHDQHSRAPIRFDARALMKVFDDFVWAKEVKLEKIAICKMGAKKVLGENGDIVDEVYEEVASIPLL
jgi:activating signal cointegrator complex subunit 1